jgi:hypothetical protein
MVSILNLHGCVGREVRIRNELRRIQMELILGIIGGGLISWLITHCYYKKSLTNQREAWVDIEDKLLNKIKSKDGDDDGFINNELRIKAALDDYKRKGTPKYIIDTFHDLTNTQKAKLYDDVLLRAKGRPGKNNPYK